MLFPEAISTLVQQTENEKQQREEVTNKFSDHRVMYLQFVFLLHARINKVVITKHETLVYFFWIVPTFVFIGNHAN